MKNIAIILLVLLLPAAAQAQTPVSKDQANAYYANCVENAAKTEQRFSPQSQQEFCACTAARLTQYFYIEDMQIMTSQTHPNARKALNKMIVNVYAPCMEGPTREYHYAQCIENPQTASISGNPDQLCACAADAIGQHLRTHGARLFQDILAKDPNIVDPMSALYGDKEFQSFAQQRLMSCLK